MQPKLVREVAESITGCHRRMDIISSYAEKNPGAILEMAEIWLEWDKSQGLKTEAEREQERLALDTAAEGARALHRIVRSMHDGHCPSCGHLGSSEAFALIAADGSRPAGHMCPRCGFMTTYMEERDALALFRPLVHRSLAIFEAWRKGELIIPALEETHVSQPRETVAGSDPTGHPQGACGPAQPGAD